MIEAPGNILNKACSGVTSAVSAAGDFFSDVGTGIADGFSSLFGKRRKKRSSVGTRKLIVDLWHSPLKLICSLRTVEYRQWCRTSMST